MKVLLKNELKRMFFSKETALALLVGVGICIWYSIQYVWMKDIYDTTLQYCPESVFYNWLGAFIFPAQTFLYYLILPLLVVLPGGATYYEDVKNQYITNIYTRCVKWKYLLAKYIAVFLTGGIVFILPLLLSLFISMSHFPMLLPEAIIEIGPAPTGMLCNLYYTHPWSYLCVFFIIDFVFAGGIAAISLAITHFVNYKLGVIIIPFVIYFGVYCSDNLYGEMDYAPNYFLISCMGHNNIWEYVIGGIVLICVFIVYFVKGLKYEV